MTKSTQVAKERVWFLDNMRYVLVLIVVVFHCVLSQVAFLEDMVVEDPRCLTIATWTCFFCYVFQMPLLFFIAGYFAVPSLRSKGAVRFVHSKVFRLLVPALLVLVLLNPIHRYIYHWSRSFEAGIPPMSYLEYLPHFFGGVSWLQIESIMLMEFSLLHLWFVTLLFVCFVAYALLVTALSGSRSEQRRPVVVQSSTRRILTQMGLAGLAGWLAAAVVLRFAGSFQWIMVGSFLLVELPPVVFHTAYFTLGIAAFRGNWFARPNSLGPVWAWFAACLAVAVVVIIADEMTVADETLLKTYWIALVYWALRAVSSLLFLGSFLSFMMRYCNRTSPLHAYLAAMSYRVYLVHYVVVCCVQFAFFKMPGLSPYVTFFGTIAASLALTYLVAAALTLPARWYGRLTEGRVAGEQAVVPRRELGETG